MLHLVGEVFQCADRDALLGGVAAGTVVFGEAWADNLQKRIKLDNLSIKMYADRV